MSLQLHEKPKVWKLVMDLAGLRFFTIMMLSLTSHLRISQGFAAPGIYELGTPLKSAALYDAESHNFKPFEESLQIWHAFFNQQHKRIAQPAKSDDFTCIGHKFRKELEQHVRIQMH